MSPIISPGALNAVHRAPSVVVAVGIRFLCQGMIEYE